MKSRRSPFWKSVRRSVSLTSTVSRGPAQARRVSGLRSAAARLVSGREVDRGRWRYVGIGGSGLFVIPVDGDEPSSMSNLPDGSAQLHSSPALAPDGHRLAYMTCMATSGGPSCGVDVVELDDRLQPVSSPRRLVAGVEPAGLAWSPDGGSVLYTISPVPEMLLPLARVGRRRSGTRARRTGRAWCAYAGALGGRAPPGVQPLAQQRRRLHARARATPGARLLLLGHPAAVLARRQPSRLRLVAFGRVAQHLARVRGRVQCAPVDARTRDRSGLAVLVARRAAHRLRREGRRRPPGGLDHRRRRRVPAPDHDGTRRSKHADVVARRALDLLLVQPGGQERHVAGARQRRISRACHARGECVLCDRVDGRQGPHLQARLRRLPAPRAAACGRSHASVVAVRLGRELRGRPCRDLLRRLRSWPRAVHPPARHDWARSWCSGTLQTRSPTTSSAWRWHPMEKQS